MSIRRISVSAALLAVLSIAACANGDAGATGAAAPSAAPASAVPSAVPSVAPPSAAVTPSSAPAKGRPAPGPESLSGTVTAGVEPRCLLLDGHVLIFDDPSMRAKAAAGTTVTVRGKAQPSMMTTCQQGTPFIVTSVR